MDANGKVNILLVDDQPSKLLSYEAILDELGENLIKASSGREALKELMTRDIAVVLVDVIMPEMDGFELATLIREHPRFRKTAIILVSAIALSDLDRLRGYDSGAVDYVPVPIVPEVLRAKVAIFTELYRKSEELRRLNLDLEQRVIERTSALESSTARLRENDERLRIALDTGRLGAWELDLTTGQMETTAICNSTLGLPCDMKLDRDRFFACMDEEGRCQVNTVVEQALESRSDFEAEYRCLWPDGSVHWIIIRGRPVFDQAGRPLRLLGVTLDITDRRRGEEERALLLESERAARVEAERAVRIKDEFLATLSHELRSPLHAILGWAQLLRRNPRDIESVVQGLETIERSAREQARLIDDLLSLSRIASGKIRLDRKTVDLTTVVDGALESIRPTARAKELTIVRSADTGVPPVEGDLGRLQQVISNLLSNAVKFTPPGGRISVSLTRAGSQVALEVADTGEGIAPEFLPHVFDRFRQADSSTTRQHSGLGLGLSIAKNLVELHGGRIEAHSAGRGQGACFTVYLPFAGVNVSEPRLAPLPETAPDGTFADMRMLVVDDDPDACELMARLLADCGATIASANSVDEALTKLQCEDFDLLLSDIGMPGRDGYELIREVRRLETSVRNIPSVAVTAFVRPEDRTRAMEAGYDQHLGKPINPSELMATLSALLQAHAARR